MSIRPIDIPIIQRSQEVSQIRQQEVNKPMTDQVNIQQQIQKETQVRTETVIHKDNADNQQEKPDAREKGKGEYYGDGGKRRKKQEMDKVVLKGRDGFDMKI